MAKLYVADVSIFGPVNASQLPDDFNKLSNKVTAKAMNRVFLISLES